MGRRLRMDDGRTLCVAEWGDPAGRPVLFLHGTPGSRLSRYPDSRVLAEAGVRLVTYDRPGYGGSDRLPGRTVADVASDVRCVAGWLGVSRLPVFGHSGGGPHALACAALLPGLVPRAASVAGIAPFDAHGLDWLAGMTELNLEEFAAAVRGRQALETELEPAVREFAENPEAMDAALEAELPAVDVEVLRRPDVREAFNAATAEALRTGSGGWVDDDLAFVRPWGFDVADLRVPVSVWHGGEDNLAPRSHAAWLAEAIPGARFFDVPGVGHLGMQDRHPDVIAWLLDG